MLTSVSNGLPVDGGLGGERRGVFRGTVVDAGNRVGAAIKMFSPTRPRSISGTISATDQLRVRFSFISNIQLDTDCGEKLCSVCKLFVTAAARVQHTTQASSAYRVGNSDVATEESPRRKYVWIAAFFRNPAGSRLPFA